MSLIPFLNSHPRRDLSAYIDGQLAPQRASRIEAHLAACDACRAEAEALRLTIAALRTLPEATAPRSFALTPQMVARPVQAPARRAAQPLAYGLRIAGAGLAVALAAVVLVDAGGISTDDSGTRSGDDGGDAFLEMAAMATTTDGDVEPSVGGDSAQDGDDLEKDMTYSGSTPMPLATMPAGGFAGISGAGDDSDGGADSLPMTGEQPTPAPEAAPADDGAPDAFTPAPEPAGADEGEVTNLDERDYDGVEEAVPVSALDTSSDGDGIDLVLALEIALAAAIALALLASFALPRLTRRV